jgi:23S rRNA (uracil1939-C5)-methyltransferase
MHETVTLDAIVGGGQAIGTLANGKKAFVWGGLPGETVQIRVTKKKSKLIEGVVEAVVTPSSLRVAPVEPDSFLSTSPWQLMTFDAEQIYKAKLIDEAFVLHSVSLPQSTEVYTDAVQFGYRNKVEFSWYGDEDEQGNETLDLAFFRRGGRGKIVVAGTKLAHDAINACAVAIRDHLHTQGVSTQQLKTLLIRSDKYGDCVWQLYVKDESLETCIDAQTAADFLARGGEIIFSDPRSPASRITKRLSSYGDIVLQDTILGTPFRYATEGFFQVNIPVYETALRDMQAWVKPGKVVDMYAGVGSIGLTIGGNDCTLVEIDEHAVREMKENIHRLNSSAQAVLAASEHALEYLTLEATVILDPPRAGLHQAVVDKLLEAKPSRIIYLSCNPVTQARDVALLSGQYRIAHHKGYNFFPRTPHIEHLVVIDAN